MDRDRLRCLCRLLWEIGVPVVGYIRMLRPLRLVTSLRGEWILRSHERNVVLIYCTSELGAMCLGMFIFC